MSLGKERICDVVVGQLVRSKAGRDKGEVFIIYQIVDDNYVLVVDGKIRKIGKPKKKKVKHLQKFNSIIDGFENMKYSNEFNDALIRRLIKTQIN